MSNVAIPMPKPAGGRPPFGPPPTKTSFDSRPDDQGDPLYKRIIESVEQVLIACKGADVEHAGLLLRMIGQRKRMVERELAMTRMFDTETLPPLLTNLYVLDFLGDDNDIETVYIRLLNELEAAANKIHRMIELQIG